MQTRLSPWTMPILRIGMGLFLDRLLGRSGSGAADPRAGSGATVDEAEAVGPSAPRG